MYNMYMLPEFDKKLSMNHMADFFHQPTNQRLNPQVLGQKKHISIVVFYSSNNYSLMM